MVAIIFIVSSHLNTQASNTLEAPQPAVAPHTLSWILGRDDGTEFFLQPIWVKEDKVNSMPYICELNIVYAIRWENDARLSIHYWIYIMKQNKEQPLNMV